MATTTDRTRRRRPKGTGSIQEIAPGRFVAFRRMTHKGQRLKSPTFTAPTRTGAQFLLSQWEAGGGFASILERRAADAVLTVGSYLEEWWRTVEPHRAITTRHTDGSRLDVHILSDGILIGTPLTELTRRRVKEFIGRIIGSEGTKYACLKILKGAMNDAIRDEIIASNPCDISNPPRVPKAEVEAFTPEEEIKLLRFVRDDVFWNAVVRLAFDAGLRRGEMFGLQVQDVNWKTGTIFIQRTIDTVRGRPVMKLGGKTPGSWRRLTIAPSSLNALAALVGRHPEPDRPLFTDPQGGVLTHDRFYGRFQRLLKAAGIPPHHFHACRHTCASRLLRDGHSLPAVSRRLGHSNPRVTLGVYAHAMPVEQDSLAGAYERFVAAVGSE